LKPSSLHHHKARKRFGQNFLTQASAIDRIIASVNPQPDDVIIEIGPGLGAITQPLLAACPSMMAIELDRDLAAHLREKFPTLHLIEGDALKTDFSRLLSSSALRKVKVVGNLPYNISTPLIFHLLSFDHLIHQMYFMLQSEVVERMAAPSGSKTYGRLSVMVQYACQVEPLFELSPHAFNPAPKVSSTFAAITPKLSKPDLRNLVFFEQMVSLAFQQRRKTLRNALRTVLPTNLSENILLTLNQRAEQLTVHQFIELSDQLSTGVRGNLP
jgi:16S rRNA (adenine1518-N6/adenine1519-N6)-dimethyltransferase